MHRRLSPTTDSVVNSFQSQQLAQNGLIRETLMRVTDLD